MKNLEPKLLFLIGGIEGLVGGSLGVGAHYMDYMSHLFFEPMEDIAFIIFSLITVAVGVYLLMSKRSVIIDTTSRYAGSF